MNGMVNSPDGPGDDPCTVTGIRAIDEPGEGLAGLEITVGCSRASLRITGATGLTGCRPSGWSARRAKCHAGPRTPEAA